MVEDAMTERTEKVQFRRDDWTETVSKSGVMMDLSREYENGAFIAGADGFAPHWARMAAEFRASLGSRAHLDLSYGPDARHRFDLFFPEDVPRGLLVFVHGGYWLAFGREGWSHLALGAICRGWAVAIPSYTLAPAARIGQITQEIAQSVRAAGALVDGPIVVTGHSAGGHLAARMGCGDLDFPRVSRVVPISALADLGPLIHTQMNQHLKIDASEAIKESPARQALRAGCSAHVWVGGQERPAFLWQARTLSEAWNCKWTVASGRHHFDVIDELADPSSALIEVCLGGL